jgi:hypothetical protein
MSLSGNQQIIIYLQEANAPTTNRKTAAMKKPSFFLYICLAFALMTMGFQCHKELGSPEIQHRFTGKLSLSPYQKTYHVNDTIWVQFETTAKSLFDENSGSRIATDTTGIDMIFNIRKRYPTGGPVEFFSSATVENGTNVSFTTGTNLYNVLQFRTPCADSRYYFRVAIVPKKTGVFSIERVSNLFYCPLRQRQPLSTLSFTFDLNDCNKDVWQSIPASARIGETGSVDAMIDRKEIFFFRVE